MPERRPRKLSATRSPFKIEAARPRILKTVRPGATGAQSRTNCSNFKLGSTYRKTSHTTGPPERIPLAFAVIHASPIKEDGTNALVVISPLPISSLRAWRIRERVWDEILNIRAIFYLVQRSFANRFSVRNWLSGKAKVDPDDKPSMKSSCFRCANFITLLVIISVLCLFGLNPRPIYSAEGETTLEPYLIKEVIHEIQLKQGEDYRSEFLDIREFQYISIYVIPLVEVLNRPEETVRYQLDAYFSIDTSMTTLLKFGETQEEVANAGFQEFGSMQTDEQGILVPRFEKLTTGETSGRVLHSRIYGPLLRVVLTNFTPDERRKFKVIAFLTRGESKTG